MKHTAYWTDDSPRPQSLPTAERLPSSTEVLVVGAGITGLNAALALRAAGVETTVVDAGAVGAGASTINGGQVNYGLKAATTKVFKMFGEDLGHAFWDASLRSIDTVEEVVRSYDIDCNFIRPGAAELGYGPKDLKEFTDEAAWLSSRVGFDIEVVGPEGMSDVIDSPVFHCAAVDKVGASLHPARYTYGLAEAATRQGATIVEEVVVSVVERRGSGHRVRTAAGTIDAEQVLLATNGYTGFPEGLRRRVLPVGSYMVATEPIDAGLAERLIPQRRSFWTARRFLNYFRRSPDDRILMGGRNDLAPDLDLDDSARRLAATVREIFPELATTPVTHTWTGRLGVTFDLMPHIGRMDGAWYALGYGGHGVGIGTYVGREVGRLISGEETTSPFLDIPHPARWYYRGRPWFYPLAARWYRMLDRFGL